MDKLASNGSKAVVTGAAGFIGSHLTHRLLRENFDSVVGIDNLRSGDWSRCPEGVNRVEVSMNDLMYADWLQLLDGVDVVFHLAAEKYNSSKTSPERLIETNLLSTERLFRACAEAEVGRVVFTSSLYAYGLLGLDPMSELDRPQPSTLYGASKLAGEHFLNAIDRDQTLSWNVARLFFIYGPRQFSEGGYKSVINANFERMISGVAPIINGDGLQRLDYVYIDDCVDALLALAIAENDRRVVNVSSGIGRSILELTTAMQEIAQNGKDPIFALPDWTHGTCRIGSPHLMLKNFGWQATTPLRSGLFATYQALGGG